MLVDHRTGDDAGVFRLDERHTLVQTVDFFTPVVDDPEAFGAIAPRTTRYAVSSADGSSRGTAGAWTTSGTGLVRASD